MIRVFYNRRWYLCWNMRLYSSQVELNRPPYWREKWAEWQLWQLNWDEMANGLQYLSSGSIWAEPAVQGKFFILQGQVIIVQGQVIILHGQVIIIGGQVFIQFSGSWLHGWRPSGKQRALRRSQKSSKLCLNNHQKFVTLCKIKKYHHHP